MLSSGKRSSKSPNISNVPTLAHCITLILTYHLRLISSILRNFWRFYIFLISAKKLESANEVAERRFDRPSLRNDLPVTLVKVPTRSDKRVAWKLASKIWTRPRASLLWSAARATKVRFHSILTWPRTHCQVSSKSADWFVAPLSHEHEIRSQISRPARRTGSERYWTLCFVQLL